MYRAFRKSWSGLSTVEICTYRTFIGTKYSMNFDLNYFVILINSDQMNFRRLNSFIRKSMSFIKIIGMKIGIKIIDMYEPVHVRYYTNCLRSNEFIFRYDDFPRVR